MNRRYPLRPARVDSRNKLRRAFWNLTWLLFYRPSPTPLHGWRRFLLRLFGAKIDAAAHPYPRARIWAPWNLEMGYRSCIANDVDCYCVARVSLGAYATVSQYSYLCTASHDYNDQNMALLTAPIEIGPEAWVAADSFVAPGVVIGEGAVVGARSAVFADVTPWSVVMGSPARERSTRKKFCRAARSAESMSSAGESVVPDSAPSNCSSQLTAAQK